MSSEVIIWVLVCVAAVAGGAGILTVAGYDWTKASDFGRKPMGAPRLRWLVMWTAVVVLVPLVAWLLSPRPVL